MKIHFDNVNFSARTGPNTFARRLAEQLHALGHTIAGPQDEYDIMLAFIEPTKRPRVGAKLVHRLDGIWFKPSEFIINNRGIKACYENADLVIWQSEFDKGMTTHHWGEPTKGFVIRNGINTVPLTEVRDPDIARLRNTYSEIFICSSNWHPQKRLRSNIELFDHCRKNFYPNSALIVMGSNPDVYVPDPNIFYTGNIPQEKYLELFAVSNWMLHLAWLDHCPNVVIESLSQGTQVICSEAGGTKELVGGYGMILRESQPYNFELADYDNPPPIDVTQVTEPLPRKPLGMHAEINIENIAKTYVSQFEELL